jgi:hypothetical protein
LFSERSWLSSISTSFSSRPVFAAIDINISGERQLKSHLRRLIRWRENCEHFQLGTSLTIWSFWNERNLLPVCFQCLEGARDPSTHFWRRSLINMCGTLLKRQYFNWTEFFNWRRTIVFGIIASLRNGSTERNGISLSPFRIKVWIWTIECFPGRDLSVRIVRSAWTRESVLYQRKWINFFAKGRPMLMINIGPCHPFKPEIVRRKALFAIDQEWSPWRPTRSWRTIVVQTRFLVRITIIRISDDSYLPVLCM